MRSMPPVYYRCSLPLSWTWPRLINRVINFIGPRARVCIPFVLLFRIISSISYVVISYGEWTKSTLGEKIDGILSFAKQNCTTILSEFTSVVENCRKFQCLENHWKNFFKLFQSSRVDVFLSNCKNSRNPKILPFAIWITRLTKNGEKRKVTVT